MTKLLNLDELPTAADVAIVLNGRRHVMKPMTLGDFIRQQKAAEALKGQNNVAAEIDTLIGVVVTAFPTLPRDEVEALDLGRLNAIFDFLGAQGQPRAGAPQPGE